MQIIYALEPIPDIVNKSLFLCGPTPRDEDVKPWRQEALKILENQGYDGIVYVPEPRDGKWAKDYDAQVEWEDLCLNQADCILFWIPRDLKTMPAFTTNIEWGRWENSGKVILGYPENAPKISYIEHYASKFKVKGALSLSDTISEAINFIGEAVERKGGERMVPLYIWRTPQFQSWYRSQVAAGNRLDNARVLFNYRPKNGNFVFLWILQVNVFINSENRNKTNEFVVARTDISSVVMWQKNDSILDSKIVLVREFRSPSNTFDGFIRELPGGSASETKDADVVAASEVHEETGLYINPSRLIFKQARQLVGTLSSHKSHLFSVELTNEEMEWLLAQRDVQHGNVEDSEQTYIEIYSVKDLLDQELTDWSTIGMIMSVVMQS